MPKKNSRRKTLSSLDLENFLSEVSSEDKFITSRRNTMSNDDFLLKKPLLDPKDEIITLDNENIDPNLIPNRQMKSDVELTAVIPLKSKLSLACEVAEESQELYEHLIVDRSNEQLIREFCKVSTNVL